mgnify:CR=1 FL=1
MKYYIGLDAHKSICTAVVVKENGEQVLRETFDTTEANLQRFLAKIEGEKSLALEESSLSQWLYLILKPQVEPPWLISISSIRLPHGSNGL